MRTSPVGYSHAHASVGMAPGRHLEAVGSIGTVRVAETTPFDKLMAKGGHGTQIDYSAGHTLYMARICPLRGLLASPQGVF